ncbi:hypothetical protein, partial [Pleurocapsa sp. CCALA 161]|uniref:hypothetical protein n=1 Tax=Pleurocapsa sp. CCALA 161 TaxID=2107688 RepID=UPI001E339B9C
NRGGIRCAQYTRLGFSGGLHGRSQMIRLTQEDSQQLGLTNDELKDAQKSWIQRCNSIYGSSLS